MKGYWKLTAALAAFVMLFIAIGVGSQGTASAQAVSLSVTPTTPSSLVFDFKTNNTICSNSASLFGSCDAADGDFTISVTDAAADTTGAADLVTVSVTNFDLAFVGFGTGADDNPKDITLLETGVATGIFTRVVTGLPQGTALTADGGTGAGAVDVGAFDGDTIQVSYSPTGALGVSKSIGVDNFAPTVLTSSPPSGFITKGFTTVVFSADITDLGAGFPSSASNVVANNGAVTKGRIQLFVGTQAAPLASSAYSAIDGGWRLSASFSSGDIANIAAKVPWWIEAEDLAGNLKEPLAGTAGTTTGPATAVNNQIVDSAFAGLTDDLFNGRKVKVTIGGSSSTKTITDFTGATGTFDFGTPFSFVVPSGSTYEIKNTGLITVDSTAPTVSTAQTGHDWLAFLPAGIRLSTGLFASNTSIRVTFTDASGLDGSTVTPVSFSVTGNTVLSTLLVDVVGENATTPVQRIPNDVFLFLANPLGSSERPTVSVSSGLIKDKAGNAATGGSFFAADRLGPGLTLDAFSTLSNSAVFVDITTDERLGVLPTVELTARISSFSGTLSALAPAGAPAPAAAGFLSQTTALGYEYFVGISSIPTGAAGAKFNIYATGTDTGGNPGAAGDKFDGSTSFAFGFELDKMLNGGKDPKVTVSDKTATVTTTTPATGPIVEAVDPLIVTVDFNQRCLTVGCSAVSGTDFDSAGESKEYPADSHRTVTLTKASLKVTFFDGSSETTNFDLATEVSSPDSKRYTIPVLNPKSGKYQLTINAVDEAGNDNLDASTAVTPQNLKFSWEVVAAFPVSIGLAPGWNLISLPFQPANPAINSVIPTTHPASIVMTFDNANQVWLVSRRDADTGLFTGDLTVMTANTAYFVLTDNFQSLSILRPPVATAAAAPPPPPAISVVVGWNLVPVVSLSIPLPVGVAADSYFGTLQSGANVGWLKAMTFSPLTRTWTSVTPGEIFTLAFGATNPCTGATLSAASVLTLSEPCQNAAPVAGGGGGTAFDEATDTVSMKRAVLVGKGYWLYASNPGVIIP